MKITNVKRDINTVKELREYLDKLESQWSAADEEFLGPFEAQHFVVPSFDEEGRLRGFCPPTIHFSVHTWLMIMPQEKV